MTHEERHVGAGEEMARRAAEHPFAEATAAICAHDHKVGLAPRRDFEQGRPDMRVVCTDRFALDHDPVPFQMDDHVEDRLPPDLLVWIAWCASDENHATRALQ